MLEEEPSTGNESLIHLPSRLRIRQRLGQISSNHLFREAVVPQIERLGDEMITPDMLLSTLAVNLSEYAKEHMLGMTALAYSQMPPIIDALVDDPIQKEATLNLWGEIVMDKKARDEAEINQMKSDILNRRRSLPRKAKKARQRMNKNGGSRSSQRRQSH